jgi:hypothetical protein
VTLTTPITKVRFPNSKDRAFSFHSKTGRMRPILN